MIEAFVRAAIETTSDEAAKPRLRRCVPPLLVAVKTGPAARGARL